jgi:acylphosphatase
MTRRVKLIVSGRVQGVCFRYSTQKKARQIGVVGTVRNLPDGNVEIIGQAETALVQALIDWSQKGPITARVDTVEISDLPVDTTLVTFEII